MIAMLVLLAMMAVFILAGWWIMMNFRPPKYNGLLWLHPEHIKKLPKVDTVIYIKREPEGQKPFYYQYDWWRLLKNWPCYLWYEKDREEREEVRDGKKVRIRSYPVAHWEPDKPPDYLINDDKAHPYVTPNELFDNTDWECARRYETVKSKLTEAIKLGMAAVMVIVCVVGIIMLVDTAVNKKPEPASPPKASELQQSATWPLEVARW